MTVLEEYEYSCLLFTSSAIVLLLETLSEEKKAGSQVGGSRKERSKEPSPAPSGIPSPDRDDHSKLGDTPSRGEGNLDYSKLVKLLDELQGM